ncbi:MAG: MSMEG_4193 family putative phosphomutase [Microthrixaceae bacterium]
MSNPRDRPTRTAPKRAAAPSDDNADTTPSGHTLMLLVRHGLTDQTGTVLYGRSPGVNLSDAGRAQAEAVAQRLAPLADRVRAVVASPIERTRQTAAPIGVALGHRVRSDRRLLEADFGDWTNRPLAELRKLPDWPAVQNHPSSFRFPGGESFVEVQNRMMAATTDWAERHRGGAVVLVSHADVIKAFVAHASGTHLDAFQRLVISPTSVTPILLGGGAPIVLAVNSTGGDLAALAPA